MKLCCTVARMYIYKQHIYALLILLHVNNFMSWNHSDILVVALDRLVIGVAERPYINELCTAY